MKRLSEERLLHLLIAGARERRYMGAQRQLYEKLREMEAEEKARRAQQQHEHHRAYYFSVALKRSADQKLCRPLQPSGRL